MTDIQKTRLIDWVEALRSGKYQQGEKTFRTNDKYCCLGCPL